MAYKIKCPYCFEVFNDNEVHFRVPTINDPDTSVLPDWCDSIEDLMDSPRLSPEQKTEMANAYWEANFYAPQSDEKYEKFWSAFDGGTTEPIPANHRYPPYRKRIIVPSKDRKYLKPYNKDKPESIDSYFRRDSVGNSNNETFVSEIKLFDDTECSERVCPKCHNPLPSLYGAYPVKFISIVGITHSGKTVYLSQFLKHFTDLLPEVGYQVPQFTPALSAFVKNNKVAVKEKLPAGTPPKSFQQPVICDISDENQRYTLVMYDVAGELFDIEKYPAAEVNKFAEFIRNSDAIMMLIDPMQFSRLWEALPLEDEALASPNTAINTLNHLLGNALKPIPFAACISKCDEIYEVMSDEYVRILKSDYVGIARTDFRYKKQTKLNAEQINAYEEYLSDYVHQNNQAFNGLLATCFDDYSYFALSALGCSVDKATSAPIGPIAPKRIMDPFYWIMYKLGLIGASDGVYNPNGCECKNPDCKKRTTNKLPEPYSFETGFFRKKVHVFTHQCSSCGCYFNPDSDEYWIDE